MGRNEKTAERFARPAGLDVDIAKVGFFDEPAEQFDGEKAEVRLIGCKVHIPFKESDQQVFEESVVWDGDEQFAAGFEHAVEFVERNGGVAEPVECFGTPDGVKAFRLCGNRLAEILHKEADVGQGFAVGGNLCGGVIAGTEVSGAPREVRREHGGSTSGVEDTAEGLFKRKFAIEPADHIFKPVWTRVFVIINFPIFFAHTRSLRTFSKDWKVIARRHSFFPRVGKIY